MRIYLDQEFNKEFVTTGKKEDKSFEVTNTGSVGIDSDANLTVEITDDVPTRLYYKFDPINLDLILEIKRGLVIDMMTHHSIKLMLKRVSTVEHRLTGTGSTTSHMSYQQLQRFRFIQDQIQILVTLQNLCNPLWSYH